MVRYIIKRILLLIPVIIAISFIVFALMELTPGDIVDAMITGDMTAEDIIELREQFNLHRSMLYRYAVYMINLAQGDLGVSMVTGANVWSMFMSRLPNTLLLSFSALVIGMVVAIPMGIIAARRAGKITDNVTTVFTLVGMSMPVFWIGILLILVFSSWLGWLPASGNRDGIRSLILPAVCSSLTIMAFTTRQTRSSLLDVLRADYLRTARAKGAPEKAVIRKHALGNAWIPIVTALGTTLATQLAGAVVVEQVFAWPGIGRMAAEAVLGRDVTTLLGTVILTTVLYVLVQLLVDLIYAFVDPRIKSQYMSSSKKGFFKGLRKQKARSLKASAPIAIAASVQNEPVVLEEIDDVDEESEYVETASPSIAEESISEEPISAIEKQAVYAGIDITKQGESDVFNSYDRVSDDSTLLSKKFKKRSQMGEIFHHLSRNKGAMAGFIIIGLLFLLLVGSLFISFDAVAHIDMSRRFTPPNWQHPFGTDNMGRDQLTRIIFGTRYTLGIGFGAAAIASFFGILLGAIAGYFGGLKDEIIMRFSDILASIPGMLLGLVIVTVLGQSIPNLILAVGLSAIPNYIRITRASIMSIRNQEYVEAARAIGLSHIAIVFKQALPNGLSPIIVTFSVNLGMSIIVAASLSFLGFGVPAPHPEWGTMISMSREFARSAPYLMTFPGLFIMITVLAFNLLGDGLRDALDPKQKKR